MTDITMVLYGVIFVIAGLVVFVIRKYILPWILTKMSVSQWNTIVDWALSLVALAEKKITGEKMGNIRFNKVFKEQIRIFFVTDFSRFTSHHSQFTTNKKRRI